jgi:hypothetical protein
MKIDFQPFFKKYQAIVTMADEVFEDTKRIPRKCNMQDKMR